MQITIATHSGTGHADDAVGVAILLALHPHARIVRTRNPDEIEMADFAVDVGGQWDPSTGRFDHHQKGFEQSRPNNGPVYASAGLVWSRYGAEFIRSRHPGLAEADVQLLGELIDLEFIQYVDMADTGAAASAPGRFGFSAFIDALAVTRLERGQGYQGPVFGADTRLGQVVDADQSFLTAVQLSMLWLDRTLAHAYNNLKSRQIVLEAPRLHQGRTMVLPASGLDWIKTVCEELPDVLFVIYPDSTDNQYHIRTVPVTPESFKSRRELPPSWAGLRDQELEKACSVPGAVFCHNNLFIAGARELHGAVSMARKALPIGGSDEFA